MYQFYASSNKENRPSKIHAFFCEIWYDRGIMMVSIRNYFDAHNRFNVTWGTIPKVTAA